MVLRIDDALRDNDRIATAPFFNLGNRFMQVRLSTTHRPRGSRAFSAIVTITSCAVAFIATSAMAGEIPDVCPALKQIVTAPKFTQLREDHVALSDIDHCRISTHVYDCRWSAHWPADGTVNDPLEELGADVAACFSDVIHDGNTPTLQHFFLGSPYGRVSLTASVQGPRELRLLVTR